DIWSFGIVIYEMLAQRLPFNGATRMDTIVAILDRDPAALSEVANQSYSISPLLEQTIDRCLRKDMTVRLGSANELLAELKLAREKMSTGSSSIGSRIGITRNAISGKPRVGPKSGHYFWPVLGLVLVLAVVVGTTLYRRNQRAILAAV